MNTKDIENVGLDALEEYLRAHFGPENVTFKDVRNAGKAEKVYGCDLILTLSGKEYYMELKASEAKSLPTNIRFTHQTLATMYNAKVLDRMIVAFVYNLAHGVQKARFKFFRFGDFPSEDIYVEPHFIIQPARILKKAKQSALESPIKEDLKDVLNSQPCGYDIGELFQTPVSIWMHPTPSVPQSDSQPQAKTKMDAF
jgi:hypothetical protein